MTGSMTRNIILVLISVMLLTACERIVHVLLSAANGPEESRPFERFAKGPLEGLDFAYAGEVPETSEFSTPEGEEITLADLRGKVILVNFWATWCGPCEAEMPSLGALQSAFPKDQFEVIAVSVDNEEDKDHAREELARWTGGTLGLYYTPEFALTYDLGARGFPTSIIYNAKGAEIARYAGELDWASIEAVGFMRAVVEG